MPSLVSGQRRPKVSRPAMGSLAYKVEGIEAAKTLLFNSCQLSPPLVRGLFALAVIGVQHTDMNLLEAALHEMKPHVTD